jgi:acyl-CoA synthetase (NDP forming)
MRPTISGSSTPIDVFFNPRNIAIVGASATPGKIGHLLMQALVESGYKGQIIPINPAATSVLGWPAKSTMRDVDDKLDVAVLVVPAAAVPDVVDDAVSAGVRGLVVISSGFAEAGATGAALQVTIADKCRRAGMRVIGPNCQGLVNYASDLVINFGPAFRGRPPRGRVSMVSQSGGYLSATVHELKVAGLGLAKAVSTGNELDVTALDIIEYLASDAATGVIVAYVEQIRDARRFLALLPEVTRKKPVVISKTGRTDTGMRAAASHTGALAGSPQVVAGAFRQVGVLQARSFDEMISLTLGMAIYDAEGRTRPLTGDRIAILSQGGGFLVEMADLCREAGFSLPTLGKQTQATLAEMVPYYGTTNNPVDFTAALMSNPAWVGRAIDAVARDPNIDGIVFLLTAMAPGDGTAALIGAMHRSTKPVLLVWPGGESVSAAAIAEVHSQQIPTFRSPGSAIIGLRGLRSHSRQVEEASV